MVVKLSYLILFILLVAVLLNASFIKKLTDDIYLSLSKINTENITLFETEFSEAEKLYRKNATFISLTVSHEDLTDIENAIYEIKGALKAGDLNTALIAKSRLENALMHLGQLSGLNIKSIF